MYQFVGCSEPESDARADVWGGEIELREHKSARWLTVDTFDSVEWLPADKDVVKLL